MFKIRTQKRIKKIVRIFVTAVTLLAMSGLGNILPGIPSVPSASAAVTTKIVTGLTTWNQVVAPGETVAVFGLNLVGDSDELFNSLTLQIMGPTSSLVALSGTAADSGVKIVQDHISLGINGVYDSFDTVLLFEGVAPSWNSNYEATFDIVNSALESNDLDDHLGNDYFVVITTKPAAEILSSSMFGFEINIGGIAVTGDSNVPNSRVEANHVFLDAGTVVINEIVTNPQQDWSSTNFAGTPGSSAGADDEWIELYIKRTGLNLTNWTIALDNASAADTAAASLTDSGAFNYSSYKAKGVSGCTGTFTSTCAGDYLVLGNVDASGTMDNDIQIILTDGSVNVDVVALGTFADGSTWDNGPAGTATGVTDESVGRNTNSKDMDYDSEDFSQQTASPGAVNDTPPVPLDVHLFESDPMRNTVVVEFSELITTTTAETTGNYQLETQSNANPTAATKSGVNMVTLVFAETITANSDTLAISGVQDVGGLSGTYTGVEIYGGGSPGGDDDYGSVMLINEVVTNPQSDWSGAGYSGTPGGSGNTEDEYIEILINRNGYDLTGTSAGSAWTMRIFDTNYDTLYEGNLAAYDGGTNTNGLFATVNYTAAGAGTVSNTAIGDFLILGDLQADNLSDNIRIELEDPFGMFVDSITTGSFNDGYTGDNAKISGTSTATESIGRNTIGADTGNNSVDFNRQPGTPGATNAGFTANIAISSVFINNPTEIGIDFTEAVSTEIATTNAAKYFDISPSIAMSSSSISSVGGGRFITVSLASPMTDQAYTFTVSKNNSIYDWGSNGTNGTETVTSADYALQGMAQDLAAPLIAGVNVINSAEIEILFTEDNGINIYGADDTVGGTSANADAIFQFSPGLGTVTAQSMWDRVRLTTATAQTSGTTYTVTISNLRDRALPTANVLSSNSHGGTTDNQTTFTGFNSSSFDDGQTPYVMNTMPSMGEDSVPINIKRLRVGFSEPMNPSSFTFTAGAASSTADSVLFGKVNTSDWLLDASNLVALASVVYDSASASIEIAIPSTTTLAASIPYALFIRGDNNGTQVGVSDLSGAEMTWDFMSNFWTSAGSDTTKPQVSSTNIDADYPSYTGVPVGLSAIIIHFDEAMNPSTIIDDNTADASNNITLTYSSGGSETKVAGSVNYNIMGNSAEFAPSAALVQNTNYTLKVTTGATDVAGNALNSQFTQIFTTGGADSTAPTIDHADSGGYMIWVQFSEPVQSAQATNLSNWTLVSGGSAVSLSAAQIEYYSWENGVEIRGLSLTAGDSFTITVASTLQDLAGNAIGSTNNTYTGTVFNMNTWDDFPMMTESYPYPWASGVPVSVILSANFSEALDAASVHSDAYGASESDTVRLYKVVDGVASTTLIAGTSTYYSSSKTITFEPTANLNEDQDYRLSIGVDCAPGQVCNMAQSIKDAGGINVPFPFFVDFRTGAGADTTAPTLNSSNPYDSETGVAVGLGAISMFFSEALNPATLNNTNIKFADVDAGSIGAGPYISGTIDYDPMGYIVDFKPSTVLAVSTNYTLRITTNVTDAAGVAVAADIDIDFTTTNVADIIAPYVDFSNADPFGIYIKFTEPVTQTAAENIRNYSLISVPQAQDLDTGADAYTVSLQGKSPEYHFMDNSVYIPNLNLTAGNKYRVTVTNVTDLAGNSINTTTDSSSADNFRIVEADNIQFNQHEGAIFDMTFIDDTVYVMYTFPMEWNVPTGTNKIKIGFSEALDNTTVSSSSILVIPQSAGVYSDSDNITDDGGVTIAWNSASNEVIISGFTLAANTEYKVKVTTAVKDGGGNTMMAWNPWDSNDTTAYESFFKTASTAGNDTTAPTVWGTNLEQYRNVNDLIVDVPLWFGAIDVMFSEQMDEDTIRAVDGAASSTIYISGATTTVTVDPGTSDTTLTLGSVAEFSTSSRVMITETDLTTVYAEILSLDTVNDVIEINKALGTDFTAAAIVTRLLKGFVDYDPWDKRATFIAEEPLGQNKTYRLIIRNRAQDITGNNMAADVVYKFTTANTADTSSPIITFTEAESFQIMIWFNKPLQKSLAENVRNYTLESPIGKNVNLDGKTIVYNTMEHSVFIKGLNLTSNNTFRLTVSTRVLDLTGNAMSDATSTDNRPLTEPSGGSEIIERQYEGYVMAHFEDFFGGKDTMIAANTFTFDNMMFDNFMNNVQVMPMNPMVGKTTNYFVNFPVTTAIPLGGQIVIKFPEGFDLSLADTMNIFDPDDPSTWGPENSPMNNDINGWSAGAVTIASVATSSAARTITITTGGATTTGSDFISIDLRGIKNPSSPHESPDYKATISTKDTGGEPLEGPFSSQPIFIQPKGTNIIQGTITLAGADTNQEIRVELYGPAGMNGETLVINDGKVNGSTGATITEGAGIAKYKFADLPSGSYNISVMSSDFSQMITVLADPGSSSTEYFAPMGHDILWVDSGDTKDYDMTLVKAEQGVAWTDNWGTERVMHTLTVVVTGGTENDKAKVNVSGSGQFFSKEITFDSASSATTTFNVPEDMYWVDVQPYMPKASFTMGPMPPPPFLSPPGIDVFVNNRKDGSEVESDRVDISLAGRSADNYLQITVRDSVNLTGVNNVEVFAHNPVGFGVPPVMTNSSGVATLKLPPGVYMVGAMVPGFPSIPDRSVTVTSAHTSSSPATLVFDVKMDLSNTFKIAGTVKDVSGNLQANVPVWAEERNSADTLFMSGSIPGMTNSEGAFEFRVVSGSSWRIQAYIPGYGDTDSISILSIAADRTTGADLTAKSELAIITGTIVLNDVAVQGAFVFAEGISGTYGFYGIHTSNDGNFSLRADAGTYKIVVSSPEFGEKTLVTSQVIKEFHATSSATIALGSQEIKSGQAARTLTLEFRDSAGASSTPEEVFVEVRDSSGNGRTETFKSVDSGTITIPDGTYTVSVYTKESGQITPFTNIVIDGAKDGVENDADSLVVTIADYVEITGKLYNDTNSDDNWDAGEELADAFVSVFSETSGATFSARTDSSGNYTIKVPVDDTYQLVADKTDYIASTPQEITVTSTNVGGSEFHYDIDAKDTNLAISGSVYFNSAVSANLANNTTDKAMVWAESSDGKWVSANIEADGSYTLYVSAGEWDVKASGHGGYETTEANKITVTVTNAEKTGNNFVLSPISGYTQGASQSNPFYSNSEGRAFSADNSVMVTAPANSIVNSETKADININIQPTTNVPEKMNKVTSVNGAPVVSNPFTPLVDKAFEITATVDGATKNVLDGSVNIQFSYADYSAADKAAIEADPTIFKCQYLNEAGQWEPTDISILDTDNELLICPTDHFSTYAPSLPTNILAPATTTGASVAAGNAQNVVTWTQNTEGDMAHYIVWETEVTEGQVTTVLDSACSGSSCSYTHTGLTNGTTYGYQILAVDDSGYTAAGSSRVTAAPVAPPSTGGITHLPSTASASTYTPDVATTTDDTTTTTVTTTEDGVDDDDTTTADTIAPEATDLASKIATLSTKPVAQMTISELKAEITKIAEIIAELQIELVKIFGETPTTIVGVPVEFKFEITLKKGMVSNDVKYMQIVLNSNPETQLASSGVGSPGQETNYFGPLTERGVIMFQEKYAQDILAPWNLTSGTGLVGSTTRAKLNSWLGK